MKNILRGIPKIKKAEPFYRNVYGYKWMITSRLGISMHYSLFSAIREWFLHLKNYQSNG